MVFVIEDDFADEVKQTREYRDEMEGIAEDVLHAVWEASPDETGYYREHLDVFADGDEVLVAAGDSFWHLIEYGSVNNPPYAPLRRGVAAAGLRLEEQ